MLLFFVQVFFCQGVYVQGGGEGANCKGGGGGVYVLIGHYI